MMESDIFFWSRHGLWGFMSNLYLAVVEVDGILYRTSEHYYQAMKTLDPSERQMISELKTSSEAKFAGKHVTLRDDWEDVKEGVMLKVLMAKFTQHSTLRDRLLATGDVVLHEDSPWDRYWGFAKGRGLDRLGILLMQVRENLRKVVC